MRDLDIHHPLQSIAKPYAVMIVRKGRERYADPQHEQSFHTEEEARGYIEWLEKGGYASLLIDLRDAAYHSPSLDHAEIGR